MYILFLNLVSSQGIVAKLGNAKVVLYPEIKGKELVIDRTILVINDNDFPLNISVEASQEITNIIEILDKNFVLQSGESKNASFRIVLNKAGDYNGKINVYFSKIGEAGGVALASQLIIYAKGDDAVDSGNSKIFSNTLVVLGLSTLLLIVVLAILVFIIKKKGKIRNDKIKFKRVKNE